MTMKHIDGCTGENIHNVRFDYRGNPHVARWVRILLFAVGIGVAIYLVHWQRRIGAVATIRQAGGKVWYSFDTFIVQGRSGVHGDMPMQAYPANWEPVAEGYWLSQCDTRVQSYFVRHGWRTPWDSVHAVELIERHVSSDVFHHLRLLKDLRYISLSRSRFGTLAALNFLSGSDKLEWAILDHSVIGDKHLRVLGTKLRIRWLNISDTTVSDKGIIDLADLTRLEMLDVSGTQLTDSAMPTLANLRSLKILRINRTRVSDDGIRVLTRLSKIRDLEIRYTQISDAALQKLQSLPSLRHLDVSNTRVTEKQIIKFRRSRPDVSVIGGYWSQL